MADFEVARSQGVCTVTGHTFGEGEAFYAVLFEKPDGFVRQDYSVEAWTDPPEDAFCFWKSQVPQKGQKKKSVIVDNEVLIDFFERLTGEPEPVKVQFRFVLALMLMRKRLLRYEGTKDVDGDRTGFQGNRYRTVRGETTSFVDAFDDYLGFLEPRLVEAQRVLRHDGSMYFHVDYREVHYCKVLLDNIFGRDGFLNEIVWAYDYGGRPKNRWPAKHDNILLYVKDPTNYTFNTDAIDRIPYMAPSLVGPEKAARGKLPTDTWWHTIVPPGGKESTGYVTQKPLAILKRIIAASSKPGDLVLDFFAGSGTTGIAARESGRSFVLIDDNIEALRVMARRFAGQQDIEWVGYQPSEAELLGAQKRLPL